MSSLFGGTPERFATGRILIASIDCHPRGRRASPSLAYGQVLLGINEKSLSVLNGGGNDQAQRPLGHIPQ